MTDAPEAPLEAATLVHDRHQHVWLLKVRCPYCHKQHTHGGGAGQQPDPDLLGLRTAHCVTNELHGSYAITDSHGILG